MSNLMTVSEAAELLETDVATFLVNIIKRYPQAQDWNANTELPVELVSELEAQANKYKAATQSVQAGSNFDGSLVKSTGDAIESTRLCAEAVEFAVHEIDPRELEQWIAAAAIAATSKIEVYKAVQTNIFAQWRESEIAKSSENLQKCLASNQDKVNEVLQRHGIPTASESLGNVQRRQAAAMEQTSKILEQVLKVSAQTR